MLLPYRVKNPVRQFPVVTVTIIGVNVVVYLCTTQYFMAIRESVVENYAFAFGASPAVNFFSAIFLHADIFHIAGNMLFLWLFGPPVEERLGRLSYVIVYFATGFAGDLLQALVDRAATGQIQPGIGASGCIMGIVGAYWYLFSWSKVCVFYWLYIIWHGVWEVDAIWIIGLFVLMDVLEGVLYGVGGVSGGVANFAHIGGAGLGALMCMVMHVKRDTETLSDAKAAQADMKDLSLVPVDALDTMLEEDPTNPDLLRALITQAPRVHREGLVNEAMRRAGPGMIEKAPSLVAYYLVDLKGEAAAYQPVHLLRLAGELERLQDSNRALHIYHIIITNHAAASDAETALYRMAQCYWISYQDSGNAQTCLAEMTRRFPNGPMAGYGHTLARQMKGGI